MAQSKRETERKYAAPAADDTSWLPDLTDVDGVASVVDRGTDDLDAVYYDTVDLRLAGASATLRRRTGGADAGWHLKLPLTGDSREEVHAPLSDVVPGELRDLMVSRTRGADVGPVVRIRTTRRRRELVDAEGTVLGELSVDAVDAESLLAGATRASWTELEVELAEDADPALLRAVDKRLRKNGVERLPGPSKLARALEETGVGAPRLPDVRAEEVVPGSAGDLLLGYVEKQVRTLVDLDPAVRRNLPDSVHQMRVTCRRLRSVLRSYRSVLDREATDPVRRELRWLAGELGAERDHEVLRERLSTQVEALPRELVLGPVAARLQAWHVTKSSEARTRTQDALASGRYLALLDALAELVARPPLRPKAARKPEDVAAKAVLKEYDRFAGRVTAALEPSPGADRDTALHQARKAAKKARYATEPALAALGKPVKRLGKRVQAVQKVLGEHQDSVVARHELRRLAVAAGTVGEAGFTWGLLYGQEQAAAGEQQRELPRVWARASEPGLRKAIGG
ncbi:CYTH and CHAD domain-containing protein [Streptomyces sp. ALI-76-A]|uniref:CYTH and CHAD domain-containing protein n=1 Tax=Streptomyces sp. ALI-76-A TaxID=3025736 RepID=UPI00256ED744|nr:CYTH and CHAD domain-containing protein [Streptomyces sp. ALI-76-A]MDL5205703.1 CYTH and CHAD domain-containing protein [Streptomyces sp. ALI-76-A]